MNIPAGHEEGGWGTSSQPDGSGDQDQMGWEVARWEQGPDGSSGGDVGRWEQGPGGRIRQEQGQMAVRGLG